MSPKNLLKEAEKIKDIIIKNRRELHKTAELGFDLKNTVSLVKKELEKMGIEPTDCGKSGIVVTVGKNQDKVFLLRADMDALPIEEKSGLDFASQNGNMHACGHDMHTAMLLGAARLLKSHEDEICGTVKLMFQPAEEILKGADDMIKSGLLENPKVDAGMMIHVMAGMALETGTVMISPPGVTALAADYFEIVINGKGCHGAMPNTGIDSLNVASHILINLQEITAREISLSDRAVLTVCSIESGNAANVIPDSVTMRGAVRSFDTNIQEFIKKRIVEISENTAKVFRADASVTFTNSCPPLVNDADLSISAEKYTKELLGDKKALSVADLMSVTGGDNKSKASGSEDFAYVSQKIPAIMLTLAAGHPQKGFEHPQHHPMVKYDEDALPIGSAVYAYTALRWLEDNKK